MVKHEVVIGCWVRGHVTELSMTNHQEQALERKIGKLKAVCPVCRNEGAGNQPVVILRGNTRFVSDKSYQCHHGHMTNIGAFTNGMLHVKSGPNRDDFENIEGTIEELEELIDKKTISCHHVGENGRPCGCKLKPMDDLELQYPSLTSIKTKTRVGDIWDKAGVDPVRTGNYDGDGNYQKGTGEDANKERLEAMRRRNAKNGRSPGKRITKPTKKIYKRRSR